MPSWADQLLPKLLMEQFDTLPSQCSQIEHMHEEFGPKKNGGVGGGDKMTVLSA